MDSYLREWKCACRFACKQSPVFRSRTRKRCRATALPDVACLKVVLKVYHEAPIPNINSGRASQRLHMRVFHRCPRRSGTNRSSHGTAGGL
ncbi:hypothetical protein H6P81_011111 [Aristolochia fimbriata]|uniref:Uncharacterized protein n=1 Tax=Aristolochia fimbriata TaxID=158543 RepID=A0AAV7ERR3_ARIFI|nr:hypothetical protein H6P81_011111 [Aristolochia fimbriata]